MAPASSGRRSEARPALVLACEAARWALKAHLARGERQGESGDLGEALLALEHAGEVERALGADGFLRARWLVQASSEVAEPSDPAHDLADLALLRKLVSLLLAPLHEATRTADWIRIRRVLRIATVLATVFALAAASILGIAAWRRGPNLALNSATSSSSSYGNQKTTHGAVDGITTTHGFHTAEEKNPWLMIDLGATKTISSIVVHNRVDCCEDRAVPLVVEASVDGNEWTVITRREKTFVRWRARFPATEARFVRLTAMKKTFLHLNEVEIYGS